MRVTATEFKTNLGKYLNLVSQTEIYITRNGKEIAKLTKPDHNRVALLDSLVGIMPEEAYDDTNSIKEERLARQ